jgi:hypothetical protein
MAEKLIQSLKDALYAPLQGLDEMTELWFMSFKEVA